ncbi:MAG: hypothetical protein JRH06_04735 [Deltaproteobacteria bacterium]|nr:hypothetical protein [Deltaproteobacteria bacterium]MBW2136845.1 hypothetical protein [Deltaproteobacteria bacterium]
MRVKLSAFLQWRLNVLLYRKLGWRLTYRYVLILGSLYYLVNRREKERIEECVEEVFKEGKDKSEIDKLKRGVFQGILAHYYEKLFNAYEDLEALKGFFRTSIRTRGGLEKLDRGLSKGRGVLFVTGHYGGIEYIPMFLALEGYPISVIAKFSTRELKESLYLKTKDLGLRIIDAREETHILNKIIRELRHNRIVFFECDEIEEWRPSKKETISFLKKRVGVDRTINLIQKRAGAVVLFGLLHRASLDDYELLLNDYEGILQSLGKRSYSVGVAILKYFEKLIYIHPEAWYQWNNFAQMRATSALDRKMFRAGVSLPRAAFNDNAV